MSHGINNAQSLKVPDRHTYFLVSLAKAPALPSHALPLAERLTCSVPSLRFCRWTLGTGELSTENTQSHHTKALYRLKESEIPPPHLLVLFVNRRCDLEASVVTMVQAIFLNLRDLFKKF